MKTVSIRTVVLLFIIVTIKCYAETTTKQTTSTKNVGLRRCQKPTNGQHICFCGQNKVKFDRLKGEKCINGQVVQKGNQKRYIN
jgi:hypothetical protein